MGLYKRILEDQMNRNKGKIPGNNGPFDIEFKEEGITDKYNRGNFATDRMNEFNKSIEQWGTTVSSQLKGSISAAGIKGNMLGSSVKPNYKKEYGEIYKVGFRFKRYGVFVHKGVGRGYKMTGSTVTRTTKVKLTTGRKPKPWFNPVIERNLAGIQQIVADYTIDAVVNTTRIFIK